MLECEVIKGGGKDVISFGGLKMPLINSDFFFVSARGTNIKNVYYF